jgi:membrane protein
MEKFEKLKAFWTRITDLKIPVYAAHTGYFVVLSIFPLLLLLLSLLRYTGLAVDNLVGFLEGILPGALMPSARQLILSTYFNTSGAAVSLSALAALWSASRGIYGIMTGLNAIYGAKESRGYFHTRWLSVVYTFVFLLMLLVTLTLNVMGSSFFQALSPAESDLLSFLDEVVDLRFFLILLMQTAVFAAMFTFLPNRKIRLRESLPGALLASSGWLIFSDLYSIYVRRSSVLSNAYGSVYAVALSMLWLYCCICIVFYGGVLNRLLIEKPSFLEE